VVNSDRALSVGAAIGSWFGRYKVLLPFSSLLIASIFAEVGNKEKRGKEEIFLRLLVSQNRG